VIIPEIRDAIGRGVILDVGHGVGSFSFYEARKALEQGIQPDTISTDLHRASFMGPAFDLPTTMSKYMNMGLSLDEVVKKTTEVPAKILGLDEQVGTLKMGAAADAVIFEMKRGDFIFRDTVGSVEKGNEVLEPIVVVQSGDMYLGGTWRQVNGTFYSPDWTSP